MSDISFKTENGRFLYRSAGVIIHENRVLLITEEGLDFWFPAGGRTQLMEPSKAAAVREVAEELHVKPIDARLLWIAEHIYFSKHHNQMCHELHFIYLCHVAPDSPILSEPLGVREDLFNTNGKANIFKWHDIDKLHEIEINPHFLTEALKDLPSEPKHILSAPSTA